MKPATLKPTIKQTSQSTNNKTKDQKHCTPHGQPWQQPPCSCPLDNPSHFARLFPYHQHSLRPYPAWVQVLAEHDCITYLSLYDHRYNYYASNVRLAAAFDGQVRPLFTPSPTSTDYMDFETRSKVGRPGMWPACWWLWESKVRWLDTGWMNEATGCQQRWREPLCRIGAG